MPRAGCESVAGLPDSVGQLSNLRVLDLTGCASLRQLPDTVGALQRLTSLLMAQCSSLMALPETLGSLAALATLNAGTHRCAACTLPCAPPNRLQLHA